MLHLLPSKTINFMFFSFYAIHCMCFKKLFQNKIFQGNKQDVDLKMDNFFF
jgi:hypothetical protein